MTKKIGAVFFIILFFSTILLSPIAEATFTTGQARRTYLLDTFRADEALALNSFLVGMGLTDRSSLNIKITTPNRYDEAMNFLIPDMQTADEFRLVGPILDVQYQHIPEHPLFVSEHALNAIQAGIKTYWGDLFDDAGDSIIEGTLNQGYFVVGLISRSRREDNNIFSDINIAYDPNIQAGWLLDSKIGMEFNIREEFRATVSYRAIATNEDASMGFNLGLRVHY